LNFKIIKRDEMKINGSKQYRKYTTKGNARGGNHASLYYSVLLPRKGLLHKARLFKKLFQVLIKKKPRRPAETLREGMIPVVRLSFITMTQNKTLSTKLSTKALSVS
jgi:hypothetical protein